jgi:hypothetical protein
MPSVFVSRPASLTRWQSCIRDAWISHLRAERLDVVTLARDEYAVDPWPQLQRVTESVDGVLVLGFRQLEIDRGSWRANTPEQAPAPIACTSPWMQLEAGMAIMASLPLLALREPGVTEGVFDGGVRCGPVLGDELRLPQRTRAETVRRFLSMVREHARARESLAAARGRDQRFAK